MRVFSAVLLAAAAIVFVFGLLSVVVVPFTNASVGWSECSRSFISDSTSDRPWQPAGAVQVCRNSVLAISYDTQMINPAVSCYHRTHADAMKIIPGRDSFYLDPDLEILNISQGHPEDRCYSPEHDNNIGHLAPSEIMSSSTTDKHSCYTMANVSPQNAKFNQEQWRDLESHVVDYLKQNSGDSLYIITGLAYNSRESAKRCNNIAISSYYFKVICNKDRGISAGFAGRNEEDASYPAQNFMTVKQVEALYGGQLFPNSYCNTDKVDPSAWWTTSSAPKKEKKTLFHKFE